MRALNRLRGPDFFVLKIPPPEAPSDWAKSLRRGHLETDNECGLGDPFSPHAQSNSGHQAHAHARAIACAGAAQAGNIYSVSSKT